MAKLLLLASLGVVLVGGVVWDNLTGMRTPPADAAAYLAAVQLTPPQPLPVADHLPAVLVSPTTPITVVHTWASWCAPCTAELPQLIRAAHAKSPQITILALSADTTPEAMETAISKAYHTAGVQKTDAIQWLHDPAQTIGRTLTGGSRQLPETLIFSGQPLHITHHIKGAAPWPLLIPYLLSKIEPNPFVK